MTIIKHEWNSPEIIGGDVFSFRDTWTDIHEALTSKSTWTWE